MLNIVYKMLGFLRKIYLLSLHHMKILYLKLNGAKIGEETWILVDLLKQAAIMPGRLRIGCRCVICADVVLICGDGYELLLKRDRNKNWQNDGITIKDNCFIGAGAIILNGVTIGPNSIVGAGTVVVDDVKPNTCVAGNPARYICDIDAYARVSKHSLIEGYSELKRMYVNKSDFLVRHFWG